MGGFSFVYFLSVGVGLCVSEFFGLKKKKIGSDHLLVLDHLSSRNA